MGKYDLKAGEFLYNVSIVIPVTDEDASLKSNVEQAVSLCGSGDIEEIIFVLWEKTTERCIEIIDSLIDEFPQVKFVKYTQKGHTHSFFLGTCGAPRIPSLSARR